MTEMKLLMEHIEDELNDACTYAKLALEYKATDLETANLFYKLSSEEMTHMEALHKAVVRLIENYKKTQGEAPEAMVAVYDFLHRRYIDKAENIARLQARFKK